MITKIFNWLFGIKDVELRYTTKEKFGLWFGALASIAGIVFCLIWMVFYMRSNPVIGLLGLCLIAMGTVGMLSSQKEALIRRVLRK